MRSDKIAVMWLGTVHRKSTLEIGVLFRVLIKQGAHLAKWALDFLFILADG